jgi:hypothetical protein
MVKKLLDLSAYSFIISPSSRRATGILYRLVSAVVQALNLEMN